MDDDRVRKRRTDAKIHFPARGWYNTFIISDVRGERKANKPKKQRENGGL